MQHFYQTLPTFWPQMEMDMSKFGTWLQEKFCIDLQDIRAEWTNCPYVQVEIFLFLDLKMVQWKFGIWETFKQILCTMKIVIKSWVSYSVLHSVEISEISCHLEIPWNQFHGFFAFSEGYVRFTQIKNSKPLKLQ